MAKLGLASLLLSVNNSVPAIAHLCKITQSTHLIYGSKFVSEAHEAQKILDEQGIEIQIIPDMRYPIWGLGGVDDVKVEPFPAVLKPQDEKKRTCVILHSSGSVSSECMATINSRLTKLYPQTGFPKPVYISHSSMIANVAGFVSKPGFSALPVYHGFGHYSV